MLIAEFVKETGLTRDAVRFYIKRGLLKPQVQAVNGYQQFDASDVERVVLIQTAQSLGFTIAQIVSFGAEFESGQMDTQRQIAVLSERLKALDDQAAKLRGMRLYLKKKIAWMQGGEVGPAPQLIRAADARPVLKTHAAACLHAPKAREDVVSYASEHAAKRSSGARSLR